MNLFNFKSLDNFIFDLDGVISNTAVVHASSWEEVFNIFFLNHGLDKKFNLTNDYELYFDGVSRVTAISNFLNIHQIDLELGLIDDFSFNTINGISNNKNLIFLEKLNNTNSMDLIFKDSLDLLKSLKSLNKNIFLASSSKNSLLILNKLNISHYFNSIYDGNTIEINCLDAKPSPDIFNFCISNNSLKYDRTVVFEDSISGISAALLSDAKFVVALDRHNKLSNYHFSIIESKKFQRIQSLSNI